MCHKCKDKCCSGCDNSSSQNNNETLTNQQIAFVSLPGRPTIMIDDPDDLAAFDETTGLGSGNWLGWAIANGNSYTDENTGATVTTQNQMNRVPVGAGDQYEVGDQFGLDAVALTANQNGTHNHAITDTGHVHGVTDTGHNHSVIDTGHSHTVTDTGHTHAIVNTMALAKNVATASQVNSTVQVKTDTDADVPDTWTEQTIDLVGSVTASSANTGITLGGSNTGVVIDGSNTGVVINSEVTGLALADSGLGEEHENRQPSSAYLFVKRIYVPA